MTTTTYQGSCFCKRVRFEAEIDLAAGTTKCNCTSCWKRRFWGTRAKPEAFRLLEGEAELVKWREASGPGGFCKHCGIAPFTFVDGAEWNGGAFVSINVAVLDGIDPEALAKIPVTYLDGLHDTWAPLEGEAATRYL